MTISDSLKTTLPYLRRYARAMSGDQAVGDRAVRGLLESLAKGEIAFDEALDPRLAVFKAFNASALGLLRPDTDSEALTPGEQRLMTLAPEHRRALLLTAMEGFSIDETSKILEASTDAVERMIDQTQKEIDAALATRVLIIEDEPVIAMDIKAIVQKLGHDVVDVAVTRDEAVAAAKTHNPGLVLADIQLADGSSGAEAARSILAESNVPVIYITAYPERLLTGDKPEPAFLITKPFMPQTVIAAIGQALFFHPPS